MSACSKDDLERVRDRPRACFRDIRGIVAAALPVETGILLQVQRFEWGERSYHCAELYS